MPCQATVYQWQQQLLDHLPCLSRSQAHVLALWSLGVTLGRSCSLSLVSLLLSQALGRRQNSVRQQLREWYYPAPHKRGAKRRELDSATLEACFAPLLQWVLGLMEPGQAGQQAGQQAGRQLALALDATSLQDRFVVLCISVLYRGCAIPVAWQVLPAQPGQPWRGHWLRLLRRGHRAVPPSYTVLVLADRGLYARWLFGRITRLGWHPLLRINGGGTFMVHGQKHAQPLCAVVRQVEGWGSVRGVAFQGQRRLRCTLGVFWDKGCAEPWLVLSDLEPTELQACWYGMRAWIEHGFKLTKREGWQWQRSRIQDAQRANRMWLVLSIATLWVLLQGTAQEQDDPEYQPEQPRRISLFRRGWVAQIVALWQGHALQWTRILRAQPWPAAPNSNHFHDTS